MAIAIMGALAFIGMFIPRNAQSSYDRFLDAVEDMLDDFYPRYSTVEAFALTMLGMGIAAIFGGNAHETMKAAAIIGCIALAFCAVITLAILDEYNSSEFYHSSDTTRGCWQIGFMTGLLGACSGLGYFAIWPML